MFQVSSRTPETEVVDQLPDRGEGPSESPSWGWLGFCSLSGGPRVCSCRRVPCSRYFFLLACLHCGVHIRGEGPGETLFLSKETAVSMNIAKGAKAKERISGGAESGECVWCLNKQLCSTSGVCDS